MADTERIDYVRDSLAEILLKQRETIARQGLRIIELLGENVDLRDHAQAHLSEEHQRYAEILILLDAWVHARIAEGRRTADAGALLEVLRDVFEYAEDGKEPAWFPAAVREMSGGGDD